MGTYRGAEGEVGDVEQQNDHKGKAEELRAQLQQYRQARERLKISDQFVADELSVSQCVVLGLSRFLLLMVLIPFILPGMALHVHLMCGAFFFAHHMARKQGQDIISSYKITMFIALGPITYAIYAAVGIWAAVHYRHEYVGELPAWALVLILELSIT